MSEVLKMWGLRLVAIVLSAGLLIYSQKVNKQRVPYETFKQLETIWQASNEIIYAVDDIKDDPEIDVMDLKEMQARAVMIRLYARSIEINLRKFKED